jgi:hypothetical protein
MEIRREFLGSLEQGLLNHVRGIASPREAVVHTHGDHPREPGSVSSQDLTPGRVVATGGAVE